MHPLYKILPRMRRGVTAGVFCATLWGRTADDAQAATLPVVCIAGNCGSAASTFVSSGAATAVNSGNTLTIQQTSQQAILNWASFNVSADGRVIFLQPGATSVALNRIFQASPSQIFGLIQANGQIYLVNQNGIVFGSGASVNVGGLLASTLNISDATFNAGLLSPIQNLLPALTSDGRVGVLDATGQPVLGPDGKPVAVQVVVQNGATLSTNATGQRILLASQSIDNEGTISAPGGQVILAAGQQVFLQASTDPSLRGLVVEVNGGGLLNNGVSGQVSASEGNVTLVGLAVNQLGRVSATTSVNENGSIRLLAQDTVTVQSINGINEPIAHHGGKLTLGPQSNTDVMPDLNDTATALPEQAQASSSIDMVGQQVFLQGGASVVAPSGVLTVTAATDPSVANTSLAPDPNAQIRVDSGAVIDLSGSIATVPVTQNLVSVQLNAAELADSPKQRDGALHGQTVIIDARVGTTVANVTADLGLIQEGILQRTTAGGSATFDSQGDVVIASGAKVNVSGGAVNYTPGIIQTSDLIEPDGTLVPIATADPNQTYIGVLNPTVTTLSNEWGVIQVTPTPGISHYDPGYTQGSSAGSIQVMGSSLVLNGQFLGNVTNGINQRSGSNVAQGGSFIIGAPQATDGDFRAPAVVLTAQPPAIVVADGASLPSDLPLQLSTTTLTEGGFSRLQIASNESITLAAASPLTLQAGGSIDLSAPHVSLLSSITIPGGTIAAGTVAGPNTQIGTPGLGLFVANGVSLDVSGNWTNDQTLPASSTPSGLALVDAGKILLSQTEPSADFDLGSNVQLLANGGAWLPRGGSLSSGAGGSISLLSSPGGVFDIGSGDQLGAFGVQGAAGGQFTLQVPRILISSGDTTWSRAQHVTSDPNSPDVLQLDSSLFSSYGFSAVSLTADGPQALTGRSADILTIAPGTSVNLDTESLVLNSDAYTHGSAPTLSGLAVPTVLPQFQSSPETLSLSALSRNVPADELGNLTVGAGVVISGTAQSNVSLSTTGGIEFDGQLRIPSGTVSMSIVPPVEGADPGFLPGQRIEIGSGARIDVSGTTIYQPDSAGILSGEVLPGGTINLSASRGSVVTDVGSELDFSGSQGQLDLGAGTDPNGNGRQTVASAGGSLSIAAAETISLLGNYFGAAGVGTTGVAPGGTLSIDLSRNIDEAFQIQSDIFDTFPSTPRIITLQTGPVTQLVEPTVGGAVISVDVLAKSGVDARTLAADDQVNFGATQLNLARSLTVLAPAIGAAPNSTAQISAPYIAMGAASSGDVAAAAVAGTGSISFAADELDLVGTLAFQGISTAKLSSSGQILLEGNLLSASNSGSLSIAGDLTLSAARIVPTTAVDYTITASGGATNNITFQQAGSLAGVPLSAAGTLSVSADNIVQGGTIYAPFGTLNFNALDTLTFAPGSLTSVSGAGSIIPYGEVFDGTSWVYLLQPNSSTAVTNVPSRQIGLTGTNVRLTSGSVLDVSGGGDLTAYQWTPGTGGTKDVLSSSVTPGLYAILPSLEGQYAPYDPMLWANSGIAPGASIDWSGGGGLAAGIYPLLPARYALLPGAFLVSQASGYQDLSPGATAQTVSGFPVISASLTFGNTGIGAVRTEGFEIQLGSYANVLGNYTSTSAQTFFAPTAASGSAENLLLPANGGQLSIAVQQGLVAAGTVRGSAAPGGEGALIQISAPEIEVDPTAGTTDTPGVVHLGADVLQSWDAGRLWLGGAQSSTGALGVTATSVTVTGGSVLSADEVVLLANDSIAIDAGATVESTALSSGSVATLMQPTSLALGGSAVLAVSNLEYLVPERSASGSSSTISIASGANVNSPRTLIIDATGGGSIADGTLSGVGAQWSLGAATLQFGGTGSPSNGFLIDQSLLSAMGAASGLRFSSTNSIQLDQSVTLSLAGNSEINFLSPALTNGNGAATSSFAADLIVLGGNNGMLPPASPGAGAITLNAREIDISSGNFGLAGFANATLDASQAIVGTGIGQVQSSADLTVLAPVLTTWSNAQTGITAGGALILSASMQKGAAAAPVLQTGGALILSGNSILDQTSIQMPSGEVTFNSVLGTELSGGASVNVAGIKPANAPFGSDGGSISINSGTDTSIASGSTLSVAAGADAVSGAISIDAGGNVSVAGRLLGSSDPTMTGGAFQLQAGSLTDFGALNGLLETGGFTAQRFISVATGDLTLANGASITARQVQLTADTGSIDIAGNINASSGVDQGMIVLSARNGLTIDASANLSANATQSGVAGGQITLETIGGSIGIDPAAQISAHGANNSGLLTLRAPSLNGDDIGIASLPANLANIDLVAIEPILSSTLSAAPSAADFSAIQTQLTNFMSAAAPTIANRLGTGSLSNVVLRPYADLTAAGDTNLGSLDLSSWRFDGQPADVSIRAAGNIIISGTVSDGFVSNPDGTPGIMTSASAPISIIAGADLSSASFTAVQSAAAADLTLGPGAIVRTGTGNLTLAAARDIVFGSGSSVYTGGIQGAATTSNTDTGITLAFATGGGNITLRAGRDVTGSAVNEAADLWNPRFQPNTAAIWGIDFSQFGWNVGALGGGDVSIAAGRDVTNVSAAVADSRTFDALNTEQDFGGGNLQVSAGRNIGTGLFYVGNGVGSVTAGGALTSSQSTGGNVAVGTLLLAGDASYRVSALSDILLQGVLSETSLVPEQDSDVFSFFRYGPTSSLTVQSRGGAVTINNNSGADLPLIGATATYQSDGLAFSLFPGTLSVASFGSDVVFRDGIELLPSATGQLAVYAARDIVSTAGATIGMSDVSPTLIPTADNPLAVTYDTFDTAASFSQAALHAADPVPATITAGRNIDSINFTMAKATEITAGGDITNVSFDGQNLNATDITSIQAGGSISFSSSNTAGHISLTGPGQLEVIAGGAIDLGFSSGVATFGNLLNPNLPSSSGASISVIAGLGAPVGVDTTASSTDFLSTVVQPSAAYQAQLTTYVENLTGQSGLDFAVAEQAFRGLGLAQQLPLLESIFFKELITSGVEANATPSPGFVRGYAAIDALFPGSRSGSTAVPSPYSGDLSMAFSRIYSLQGGTISILVPGGSVDVGTANPPPDLARLGLTRTPSDLGIVAVGPGDVDVYSYGDVLVNSSRIFTLGGGNIAVWSTIGNIDAGQGAKASISAPPPTLLVDSSGNVTLDFSGAVAGSGIRTIEDGPDVTPGNVDLIAPVGFINAGDAGIGASGNVLFDALHVFNANNVSFGGTAVGVPPEVSGLAVSLSAAANASSSSTSAASASVENAAQSTAAAPLATAALSWLDVFVEGFGEEVCKSTDEECLKRNRK